MLTVCVCTLVCRCVCMWLFLSCLFYSIIAEILQKKHNPLKVLIPVLLFFSLSPSPSLCLLIPHFHHYIFYFFFFYIAGNVGKQIKGGYLLRYKSKYTILQSYIRINLTSHLSAHPPLHSLCLLKVYTFSIKAHTQKSHAGSLGQKLLSLGMTIAQEMLVVMLLLL